MTPTDHERLQTRAPRKKLAWKGVKCPSCGGNITLRLGPLAQSVACPNCRSVLDPRSDTLTLLQKVQAKVRIEPRLPLGVRGVLRGVTFEVTGFVRREVRVDGESFHWDEYLLFNPYHGFRFLTEENGHWNLVAVSPRVARGHDRIVAIHDGRPYRRFQSAKAHTTYVIGEFYWQVEVGETASSVDFIAPPYMLSVERTLREITFSVAENIAPEEVWAAFSLRARPPARHGVGANQRNPWESAWLRTRPLALIFLAALLVIFVGFEAMTDERTAFNDAVPVALGTATAEDRAFEITGIRPTNVELNMTMPISNDWVYITGALVHEQSQETTRFAREFSFYSGLDEGVAWSEGERSGDVLLMNLKPGTYRVRLTNEDGRAGVTSLTLEVKQGVILKRWLFLSAFLLLAPIAGLYLLFTQFEHRRWRNASP